MVSKRHKITNVPLIKKIWDIICFCLRQSLFEPFLGTFWGGLDFFGPPQKVPWNSSKKNCPAKKNYVPQFLKQRYINSYFLPVLPATIIIFSVLSAFFLILSVKPVPSVFVINDFIYYLSYVYVRRNPPITDLFQPPCRKPVTRRQPRVLWRILASLSPTGLWS